jgi:hypothetical protein
MAKGEEKVKKKKVKQLLYSFAQLATEHMVSSFDPN